MNDAAAENILMGIVCTEYGYKRCYPHCFT